MSDDVIVCVQGLVTMFYCLYFFNYGVVGVASTLPITFNVPVLIMIAL